MSIEEISNNNIDDEEQNVTITLTFDNDQEAECVVLNIYKAGDNEYIALLPVEDEDSEEDSPVYIYRYSEVDGQPKLDNIETDEEYEIAADAFDEWLDDQMFEELPEEE